MPVGSAPFGERHLDAELRRRIDARRYPDVTLELDELRAERGARPLPGGERVTIHGVTRPPRGTVVVAHAGPGRLSVTGEQVVDIRDFDISSPTVLMLRIYPDVVVKLYLEAEEVER